MAAPILGDLLYRAASLWTRLAGNTTTTRKFLSQTGSGAASAAPSWDQVTDADLSTSNITTNNVSITKHGFTPVLPNDATKYLDGTGNYTVPAGSGTGTVTTSGSPAPGNLTKFSGATAITNADLTGDVTTAGTVATTIANSAVTLAKIANASANSKLVGSGASGSGAAYSEITLGSNLTMTGTTLSATGTVAGAGGLVGVQTITATGAGTYTPTSGTTFIIMELVGGGGGGAGVATAGSAKVNLGGGGGGGGYVRKKLTAAFSGAGYVVGAKGTGGSAGDNNGNNGSDTTFTATGGGGTVYTAGGGVGGVCRTAFATPINSSTSAGGVATNGDVNIPGGYGIPGQAPNSSVGWASGGGASQMGAGGHCIDSPGPAASTAGANATGYGGGGSGAFSSTTTGVNRAGGDGTDGVIIIWEYS